ncbi:MAG TPA: DUF5063 domain-containing protein [Bacteroidales bacterium]|nr:DUF5063 domain-containing protein [Bacteroidales bacterium]
MEDVKGPIVKDFVKAAADFCQLVEQASKKKTGELFNEFQQLVPALYMKAALLPLPKYCYDEEMTAFVKEDDYARIHDGLQHKFELFTGITGMSPGTLPNQHELISFALAESFTDLYEELKNFVKLYEVGLPQSMNDAVWFCRKSFEQSLGIRIIESLKSLHSLVYDKNSTGSRAIQNDDFLRDEEEPWFSDDQEQVYGDDE